MALQLKDAPIVLDGVTRTVEEWFAYFQANGGGSSPVGLAGIWPGREPPPLSQRVTYEQFVVTGQGYYAWLDLSALPNVGMQLIQAVATSLAILAQAPSASGLSVAQIQATYAALGIQARDPTAVALTGMVSIVASPAALALAAIAPSAATISAQNITISAAAVLAIAAQAPTAGVLSGGATSLGLFNPSFGSALLGAEGDGWWAGVNLPKGGAAGEAASVSLISTVPLYSGGGQYARLFAQGGHDLDTEEDIGASADLWTRTTKAALLDGACTGHVKFKARVNATSGQGTAYLMLNACNAGGASIGTRPVGLLGTVATALDTYRIAAPTVGQTYDFDIDLVAALSGQSYWATTTKIYLIFTNIYVAPFVGPEVSFDWSVDYFDAR